jgi:hypothetical protein
LINLARQPDIQVARKQVGRRMYNMVARKRRTYSGE